jgi:hypothetical protein
MVKRVTLVLLLAAAPAAAFLAGRLAGEGEALDIGMCLATAAVCSAIVARSAMAGPDRPGCAARPNQALQQTAGHDWFLGLIAHRCPAAAELGR